MNSTTKAAPGKVEVPLRFFQLGLLVVDCSGSMTEPVALNMNKAQATGFAIRDMFTRFKESIMAQSFAFAVISYDETAKVQLPVTHVGPALDDTKDYNPLDEHGGGTNIYAALEEAEKVASAFLNGGATGSVEHSVVIVVMSDGRCSDPHSTVQVADRIKNRPDEKIKICSVLFETQGQMPEGEALLKQIATNPNTDYTMVHDKDTLRDFFIRSVSSVGTRSTVASHGDC